MENLNKSDWFMILEAINRGRCILLVGSDVVFDDKEHSSVSLTRRLAQKLTKSLPNRASAMPDDLAHVAQLRKNAKGRFDLEFEVEEFYASQQGPTFEFHRYLAGLPFTLCLTTTPDDFMTQAFCEIGKRPIKNFYHFRKHRETNLSVPTREHPIVYSLFGHLSELDSLVLTETDLLDYLVNVVKGTPSLPPFIAGQLADRQTSFLFLGFGFQQWYLRVFLHALREVSVDWNPSLAIEASSFFAHPDSQRAALFYGNAHKIEFRHQSWSQFAAELCRRYRERFGEQMPLVLPAKAPKVFLCYDRQDRDQVEKIAKQLHDLGINTWRDQQDLRGGDNWDRRIEQVIQKQVDYVLVLQTPNMMQRGESYVKKEIKVALERQDRFNPGELFLIPAILQPCKGFEHLCHLHQVDLTNVEGVRRLANDIHQDWTQRQAGYKGSPHHE